MEILLPRERPPRRAPGAGGRREGLRWRRLARQLAESGRLREAADVQQALVSSRLSGGPRARLRDRFRLLRCQLALGHWSDALANIEVLYTCMARRGILGGVAAGWVFLARAGAHFHLGHGARFRRSLATVLRGVRRGPASALRLAAYRLAAADAHLARRPERAVSARERAWDARVFRASAWQDSPRRIAEAAAETSWPAAVFARFADRVPARPSASRELSGVAPADPWSRWIAAGAGAAGRPPLQLLPELARLAEERVAEAPPEERRRIHAALARDAAAVREPWVKACVLEALAEATLWLPSAGNGDGATALLLQARTDLGLAAGLFRRMEWPERAARCEERWARLAIPALGAGVCERSATTLDRGSARAVDSPGASAAEATPARRLHPEGVRVVLQEAGFATADRRVLHELAPLLLLAPSPLPVLILGESGTGKEVLARAVHRWSRLRGEFVPIHCGAIPRDLLESELFGHARGAFTGASGDKPGLIEAAGGGTLFLDEIGEMGTDAQMKMLRVLESGEVRRLGDLAARRAAIRLVAATHRDLEAEVAAGRFRLDLFHRIRGVVVRLRPLRERRGDIPLLAARVLAQGGPPLGLSTEAMTQLLACEWPGNVRELKAVLSRAAHLARALGLRSIPAEFLRFDCAPLGGSGWFPPEGESTGDFADVVVAGTRPDGNGGSGDAGGIESGGAEGGSFAFLGSGARGVGAGGLAPERSGAAGSSAAPAGTSADRMDEAGLPRGGLEAYLEELERHFIVRALEEHGWNRTRAARSLGDMSRTTLLSKMKRLGIETAAGEDETDAPG